MDQRYQDLYAAVARQAVHDLHSGYTSPKHMDAGAWLEEAGLLEQAQRHGPRRTPRTRGVLAMTDQPKDQTEERVKAALRKEWPGDDPSFERALPGLVQAWKQAQRHLPKRQPDLSAPKIRL